MTVIIDVFLVAVGLLCIWCAWQAMKHNGKDDWE